MRACLRLEACSDMELLGACIGNYGQHTAVGPDGKIPNNYVTFEDRHVRIPLLTYNDDSCLLLG